MNDTRTHLTPADREELARILAQPIKFIDHPSLHEADAERTIITNAAPLPEPDTAWLNKFALGDHTRRNRRKRLLWATEQSAFAQFNFARMNASRCRAAILAGDASDAMACELLRWHRMSVRVRDVIVGHFFAAVISLSRSWRIVGYEHQDIIAEGMLMLIELAGRFDWSKPGQFMTAIQQCVPYRFHKLHYESRRYRRGFGELSPSMVGGTDAKGDRREEDRQHLIEQLRIILDQNRAQLTKDELRILKARFWHQGKTSSSQTRSVMALHRIAQKLHIHHVRINRLLTSAMDKLRAAVRWVMQGKAIAAIVAERFKNRIIRQVVSA